MSHRAGKPRCATPPAPAAFRRFQVGSADALAGDLAALQAALGDFHRTHYVARRMQLWLQGPQSLEAARFAAGLAAGEPPPPAPPLRTGEFTALQLAVSSQPALWRCPLIALSDNVTLLREFLLDEAPGSLMASLRQRRLAGDVALNWLYPGSVPRLAGAGLRQRPAGRGRPADNPLAAGATANDA